MLTYDIMVTRNTTTGHCPVVGGTPGHAPNNTDVNCDWIASGGADACHPSNEGYGQLAKAVKARLAP